MRISVIGCGGITGHHIKNLAGIEDVELNAFCDVVKEKAESKSREYGGKAYEDFREMLDREKPDACFICVPPFAHVGQEEMCVDMKIPFFVEKPVHLDLEKAKELAGKIEATGLITSVGYVMRYYGGIIKAREIMRNEKIGLVMGRYLSGGPPGQEGSWLHKKHLSGGQVIEQATHIADAIRYLAGEIEEVCSYKFQGINSGIYKGYDTEDASVTSMKLKNGAIGSLLCTWLGKSSVGIELIGKDISVSYERRILTVERGGEKETFGEDSRPMIDEVQSFVTAVREKKPALIRSDYPDAVKTLELTVKCNISMETGKPVKIS